MAKLSVVIPARDERFLTPTIDDVLRNAHGDTEVVAVLDSNVWPGDWKEVTARHGDRLTTIHNGSPLGMRASINRGVASAVSRGAQYIMKLDGHCSLSEGFDEILKAECDADWVMVPRRLRLDPESWAIAEPEKPPHDYHYLSFPDDPNDFGGPGLNGKPWFERQKARADILLDEEMSSQGSAWFVHADYFQRLELMDEADYGPFWNEFQEIGLKCWLSGGKVMVNKRTWYAHLHKGKKYGRGYRLDESALTTGRNHTMKWIWNEAWDKQTLPFSWLINHFWPVPSWPENWEEVLYRERPPRLIGSTEQQLEQIASRPEHKELQFQSSDTPWAGAPEAVAGSVKADDYVPIDGLRIHFAYYGTDLAQDKHRVDVTARVCELVKNDSLDIIVNNSTLTPGQNPFRGEKKRLWVSYSYADGDTQGVIRDEKDWLIIGQVQPEPVFSAYVGPAAEVVAKIEGPIPKISHVYADGKQIYPTTPTALNDYLIRKFSISPQRLKAPMPIELRDFHRNDLAQLFAELGFKRGAEIGVAEGNYSEVLLKANPDCELLLVDPWHAYNDNPQNKTKEKHEFAYNETLRKTKDYPNVRIVKDYSNNAVRDVPIHSLDFVYIDGQHQFNFVMADLIEWSERVRSGGVVSGDDYYRIDVERWGAGPVEAVQAYTNAHRIAVWYVFQGHKSVDFMWVKP